MSSLSHDTELCFFHHFFIFKIFKTLFRCMLVTKKNLQNENQLLIFFSTSTAQSIRNRRKFFKLTKKIHFQQKRNRKKTTKKTKRKTKLTKKKIDRKIKKQIKLMKFRRKNVSQLKKLMINLNSSSMNSA